MRVRSQVVKGRRYFKIVEGVRTGTQVRQRLVLSLGRESDPQVVLREWKRLLSELKQQRKMDEVEARRERQQHSGKWYRRRPKARKLGRTDDRIARLKSRIEILAGLINAGKIGMAPKRKQDRSIGTTGRKDG
jgi:hypothetical protein